MLLAAAKAHGHYSLFLINIIIPNVEIEVFQNSPFSGHLKLAYKTVSKVFSFYAWYEEHEG
jgi:hypothetical protein